MEVLRLENERYKLKCEELERWVVILTNSFYEGNTQSLATMDWALQKLEANSQETFRAKLVAMQEKKKVFDLQSSYAKLLDKLKEREEYAKIQTEDKTEVLVMQRQALEDNLKVLTDEVEELSQSNERMLKDLKQREFFQQYQNAMQELRKMKRVQQDFINMSINSDPIMPYNNREPNIDNPLLQT